LFFDNLDLILAHEQSILSCDEYFFCRPEFTGLRSGFCQACGQTDFVWDGTLTWERMRFASSVNRQFKDRVLTAALPQALVLLEAHKQAVRGDIFDKPTTSDDTKY
jgi:hypothetical protein